MPGSIPARSSGVEALQQARGLLRALSGGQSQPVTRLLRLAVQTSQFQLGTRIAGARGLAQQFEADATITRIAAVAAQQLAEPALGSHHALAGRLLEQAAGEVLDAGVMPQSGTIQEPECQANRQAVARTGLMLSGN